MSIEPSSASEKSTSSNVMKSHLGFPVVGIGASAGGVAALQRLLEQMPAQTGMAFVVVVHLSPTHESALDAILQRSTKMAVSFVDKPTPIEADHIYVISPSLSLAMSDGYLRVGKLQRMEGHHTAIDLFFRSLAEAHQERAIGIVLSGTGADGTQGLKRLKEMGGVTLAQSPDDAEYDGMPRSAIASGLVDIVLPAVEMADRLVELWDNAKRIELPSPPPDLQTKNAPPDVAHLAEEALVSIKALLRERTGHDFSHYKRATILRRLERRMQVNALPGLTQYRQFLEGNPNETSALLQDLLISVTNFFRDREAFEAVERALMHLLDEQPFEGSFRAWVAGCATGEEAYSIAMVLQETIGRSDKAQVQVFGSDIDQKAIALARAGVYPESIVTDVPPARLRDFFVAEPPGYRVEKAIRETVLFSLHNVLRDPPFTKLDLVCCRNLLIYLDRQAQEQVLGTFHFALKPGGLLFLGTSESADVDTQLFVAVDKKQRLFRALPAKTPHRLAEKVPKLAAVSRATNQRAVVPRPPLELLHEEVARDHAPPTILIDENHSVLHVSPRATSYLMVVSGVPSNKILEIVRPELRTELRTALFKAIETKKSVDARPALFTTNGLEHRLIITVRPVRGHAQAGLMLVVFDETEISMDTGANKPGARDLMLVTLEQELVQSREILRNTAGESAASTEELRASNEELHAMNEELRAATEELESSREELQSVNEELTTVNVELRLKVDETSKANDDVKNLISSTSMATVFLDRDLRIKLFTPAAATLFNLLPTDEGRGLLDITHRLAYDALESDLRTTLRNLQTVEREVRALDGRWFILRLVPYRTNDDRIDGVILTFIDITARRNAEERLRIGEEHMRAVVESTKDYAIFTLDVEGIITSWNGAAQQLFGWTSEEAVGRSFELIFTAEDVEAGAHMAELRAARDMGRARDDRWHRHKDGRTFFCSGVMSRLSDGKLAGYAKIARDLTFSKVLESQRDEALRAEKKLSVQLAEAVAMKDEFIAVVSHELKNPLNLIQVSAELLSKSPEFRSAPLVIRTSQMIRQAVASQVQIINDLLDMSRVNAGKVVLTPSHHSFAEVVRRILVAMAADAEKKALSVTAELDDSIEVYADPVRVEQIVWNLATNALKFTPHGGSVAVALQRDGGMARLDVTDSGIGFSAENADRVFQMFHQTEPGSNRVHGGLGIGLALVKRFADMQHGRVSASSAGLNKGATFSVWLPLDHPEVAAQTTAEEPSVLQGCAALLIADDHGVLAAFAELLELDGAAVVLSNSVDDAGLKIASSHFDLVLFDPMARHLDQTLAVAELRKRSLNRDVRVFAVADAPKAADATTRDGVDAYLVKPIQIEQLWRAFVGPGSSGN